MSGIDETQFRDDLAALLSEHFSTVRTEVTIEPSGNVCDLVVEAGEHTFVIEVADKLEWGDPTQARFYADQLGATPIVAVPAGRQSLDNLLPIATLEDVTVLPLHYNRE